MQMQATEVLEVRRSLEERVNQLVEVYGHQGSEALADATHRISRRLGPQRTRQALDAIACADWHGASRAMLDYYDRCYDHELERAVERRTVSIEGLSPDQAADHLLSEGFVQRIPSTGQ